MKKLENRVAIITGSSRGIGKAIALKFASEGANIVINYANNYTEAQNTLAEVIKYGVKAITVGADISKEEDAKRLIETTVKEFGRVDILVNNAGIVFDKDWNTKTYNEWIQTLSTNLVGPFILAREAAEYLKQSSNGRIINISSTNATHTLSTYSMDYDASKAGLVSLTKNLATALAPKVLVNAILPGWVKTDINKELPQDYIKEEIENTSVKRFAEPEEIANMALFLASSESSFMNGSIIEIDGGYGLVE